MNVFSAAVRKLTLQYLAVIMVLSLIFSFVLYQVANREITGSIRGQGRMIIERSGGFLDRREINRILQREQTLARQRLVGRLIVFNVVVLGAGALASYYLARETMVPLEKSVEAQARFTADASHELRTPLTAMRTEIEVALRSKKLSTSESKQLLTSNLEEVNRLESLVGGLLALARLPGGSVIKQKVELAPIVDKVVLRLRPISDQRSITVQTSIAQSLAVIASNDAVDRTLTILLDNAIKYSLKGGMIDIRASRYVKQVRISVTDSGVGIKPSDQAHIFERFYRADQSRTTSGQSGYGLGLAIARETVELYGGRIVVKSQPGKGSTFTVSLPSA